MSVNGAVVAVVGAGFKGKRPIHAKLAALGARLVIIDEPGHWSEELVDAGIAWRWLAARVLGNPDRDAEAVREALTEAGVRPDAVLTYWENAIGVTARVATALGLPSNPVAAIDAARSKVRTRELSAELGIPSPRAQRVRSLDELFAVAPAVGFPAVVKPEFGASAVGCVKVDGVEDLPRIYSLVRSVVTPDHNEIFRTGNDLLIEEYLDGVEFDVDLVMHDGLCVFSSVSQNWPTAEPSFQETGLHIPADYDRKAVARLVEHCIRTAQGFGLTRGVLHIEGKCTSRGPRVVEVNARMGGGRIHEYVRQVWGVDLVEAHLRSALDLPPNCSPARKPLCAVVDTLIYAPASGRLANLSLDLSPASDGSVPVADIQVTVGDEVHGPEEVFATLLVEVSVAAKNLKSARAVAAAVVRSPPVIA